MLLNCFRSSHQHHFERRFEFGRVAAVFQLAASKFDFVTRTRRNVLAHVVDLDRQLTVAAVDQGNNLHARRPTEVDHRVHRRANGSASADDVFNNEHNAIVYGRRHLGYAKLRTDTVAT